MDANALDCNEWDIVTQDTENPLRVKIKLRKSANSDEYCINLDILGLVHPYLSKVSKNYNYTGDAIKNPALLEASKFLREGIISAANDVIARHGVARALSNAPGNIALHHGRGYYYGKIEFNPNLEHSRQEDYSMASEEQLRGVFNSLKGKIDALIPQAQAIVDAPQNTALWPATDPSTQQLEKFEKDIRTSWAMGVRSVENTGAGRARGGSVTPPTMDN